MQGRSITVGGRALAYPAVCAPLVARTTEALAAECAAVAAKGPDLIEWRVDFFDAIGFFKVCAFSSLHCSTKTRDLLRNT